MLECAFAPSRQHMELAHLCRPVSRRGWLISCQPLGTVHWHICASPSTAVVYDHVTDRDWLWTVSVNAEGGMTAPGASRMGIVPGCQEPVANCGMHKDHVVWRHLRVTTASNALCNRAYVNHNSGSVCCLDRGDMCFVHTVGQTGRPRHTGCLTVPLSFAQCPLSQKQVQFIHSPLIMRSDAVRELRYTQLRQRLLLLGLAHLRHCMTVGAFAPA